MHCANPDCCNYSFNLRKGSLRLMDLEVPRDQKIEIEDNGFPCRTLPAKYFWLCVECSQRFILSRWTPSGIVLLPRRCAEYGVTEQVETAVSKPPARIHTSDGLERELQEAI